MNYKAKGLPHNKLIVHLALNVLKNHHKFAHLHDAARLSEPITETKNFEDLLENSLDDYGMWVKDSGSRNQTANSASSVQTSMGHSDV